MNQAAFDQHALRTAISIRSRLDRRTSVSLNLEMGAGVDIQGVSRSVLTVKDQAFHGDVRVVDGNTRPRTLRITDPGPPRALNRIGRPADPPLTVWTASV